MGSLASFFGTFAFILILILGIIAIVQGARNKEYKGSNFWFYISFWVGFLALFAGRG